MFEKVMVMKQCPICQSIAFDDAAVCYGCLHEFNDDDEGEPTVSSEAMPEKDGDEPAPVGVEAPSPAVIIDDMPPSFVIQIKPERERSGLMAWKCTVDLVPA